MSWKGTVWMVTRDWVIIMRVKGCVRCLMGQGMLGFKVGITGFSIGLFYVTQWPYFTRDVSYAVGCEV